MLRLIRLSLALLMMASLCLIVWQHARTQSTPLSPPFSLGRVTYTPEDGLNLNPSISGDGRVIAFESTEDVAGSAGADTFRAIRANVSTHPPTFLQMGLTRAPAPAISQDGSRIAFASKDNPLGTNNDANSEIFLYDGVRLIQVTNTSPDNASLRSINGNFLPSISDNGRFIAFSSNRDLANQNADGNFEIFICDAISLSFTQLTNSSGIAGSTDSKISGDGSTVVYIRDNDVTESTKRDLLLQNRVGPPAIRTLASDVQTLAMTYGRAISDDGQRVVWSVETAANTTQVFLFDGRNDVTRQITNLGSRATDVPLYPTISGNGLRIAFATRRSLGATGSNSDGSVELYTFDIPSGTFGRVTSVDSAKATADVLSSMNDDGTVIAFNFPRILSGPVANDAFGNNSEIYLSETPATPANGSLSINNRASMGHEPSATKTIAPDSIAVAYGSSLSFRTEQARPLAEGVFPLSAAGTSVTVDGRPAEVLFASPTEVHFHVPAATELGLAEVVVTNSDGFPSRTAINIVSAAPGIFTRSGDGLGQGMVLNAETLTLGPFDPTEGQLRLIIFSTGVRSGSSVSVSAGGRALTVESIQRAATLPGLDEVHVLVPADLRGAGEVELVIRADGRDSNSVRVEFSGDARRDILINEFLTDPPDGPAGDANHDGARDASQDEFIELVNTTTRDINISGYQILTRSSSSAPDTLRHAFPSGTIIFSCTALVIFGGGHLDTSNATFGGAQVLKASSGSLALANSSGVITILDSAGKVDSSVVYGGSTGLNAGDNQSLTRAPDIAGTFVKHAVATGGARQFSPGTELNGSPFRACTPTIGRVEVSPSTATLEIGEAQQFTARPFDGNNNEVAGVIFRWQSSNTAVFAIDEDGAGTGMSAGSTQITAVGRGVTSLPALLFVKPPPPVLTSISISPVTATLAAGETKQFTAEAKDQFGQNIGGVEINFSSNDVAVANVETTNTSLVEGSSTVTIATHLTGVAEIRASATSARNMVASTPATIIVEPASGQLLISEFRTRGPAGAADEFVEIYNPTTSAMVIGGLKIRASNGSGTVSERITVASGATLGPGCHYLVANNSSGGYSGLVNPDQTYANSLTDDGGIAITSSNNVRIIDAVGMSNGAAYKEGSSLAPLTNSLNRSYERKPGGAFGNGVDSNNNAVDFSLNASSSNPQNRSSGCLDLDSADLSITQVSSPNPVLLGADITYYLTVTNHGAGRAEAIIVAENLPPSLTFVSCSSTGAGVCNGAGNSRTVSIASLASGESITITFVATANAPPGPVANTATVSSVTPDPRMDNNSAIAGALVQSPPPELSIDDVSLNEGDSGTTDLVFTVSLSAPAPADVVFDIGTLPHTAAETTDDYRARSLVRETIPSGQQEYRFSVAVMGDMLVESKEDFFVNITNVSGAVVLDGQGVGTIVNDDAANLVISQLYGGGGNSGAPFTNDFVELFNRGNTTMNFSITPYSIQYAGASANFGSNKVDLITGTILPGQYFLVQLGGGANGLSLPTSDAAGSIVMAATAGKVALVNGATPLSGSGCPLSSTVADFVGYGAAASCSEGNGPAPSLSGTTSAFRRAGGCTDTEANAADFFVHVPLPRNAYSLVNNCSSGRPPTVSITDSTEVEGNNSSKSFRFTVSLSAPAPATDISFDIATQNNTATTANNDYETRILTNQIIPAGQQTYIFEVVVNGDLSVEPDETLFVNLTNVVGATVTHSQAIGTIENDDLPKLSINDVSLSEGDSGTTLFNFTVGLTAPAPSSVTFDIATQDGTATASEHDYIGQRLTGQTIGAGQQSYDISVVVNGDRKIEPNETFLIHLTNVSGATVSNAVSTGTIRNDDSAVLSVSDVVIDEGNRGSSVASFNITSSLPAPDEGLTFDIETQDNTATASNGDYVLKSLTSQTIPVGQTSFIFEVTINGDPNVESDESFSVNISNPGNATIADGQGLGTIINDDVANLVISQIYAGGGNSGAIFSNDFVEIFNRGATTVNFAITPYSIQYAGAASNLGSNKVNLTIGTVEPGQYFLVQLSGGANGSPLPTPDASGSIAMAATAGKVALVEGTASLAGSGCPIAAPVADFVGYGATANCFAGNGTTPALSATTAALRKDGGCIDTDDNTADFFVHAPLPRNTNSIVNDCSSGSFPTLSIDNVTEVEGDNRSTLFTFMVSVSAPAFATDVTFDIATQNNSATAANNDYETQALTKQIIPAGQRIYTFDVVVNGDTTVEPDEIFLVNLTNVSGAMVTHGQAIGTIKNDDLPTLSVNDISIAEGNSGSTLFNFTVSSTAPAPTLITFDIATEDDTATVSDNDYFSQTLTTQTIAVGNKTYDFTVVVNGDRRIEPNETFRVRIASVSGATVSDGLGIGTIRNDDAAVLSIDDVAVTEGNDGPGSARFTITSSLPAPAGGIVFDIATQDNLASASSGDYVAKNLTNQIILPGDTSVAFQVTINGDSIVERDEPFLVNISNPFNATIADGQGIGMILNDDVANLMISQLYAGGGNSGAPLSNDFVEILNRGKTTVHFGVTPYSIQYAGATANFGSNKVNLTSGTMAPGQYFLVQLSGGPNGSPLPVPDATGSIAMAATAGKVALVEGTASLAGSGCPIAAPVADFVGYGATANCFAGSGTTPAPSATTAALRKDGGCIDTDDNTADFFVHSPAPRNASAPFNSCSPASPPNLTMSNVRAAEGDSGSKTFAFTVSLSVASPSSDVWFDIGTADDTATAANNDYETRSLTNQIIPAGQRTYTFEVTVNGDIAVEQDETFLVKITNVRGANVTGGQAAGIIDNDDLPTLSISDVSLTEGDTSSKAFNFVVSLSAPAPTGGVVFDIATQDSSATTADSDYIPLLLAGQRINPGEQTFTFTVTVNGDLKSEPDEVFIVNILNLSGATPADTRAIGTIQNDDTPKLSVNDVAIDEGNSGTATLSFTVSSSLPAPAGGIAFNIATQDGSASASSGDYEARSLTNQTIAASQTTYSFSVTVKGDTLVEPNEFLLVKLSSVSGGTIADDMGQGTIQNDDVPNLVISQIYGGGGNSGAVFKNDFIEVFNRGNTTVNLAGWSVQYSAATSSTWSLTPLCASSSCLLMPGRYFLIQEAQGSGGATNVPAPDALGTISMTAAAGKVALVSASNALTGSCPTSANILDMVGYGATASCFEGVGPAPGPSNTLAGVRKGGGCVDAGDNRSDFFSHAASPRNSFSPLNTCSGQTTDLIINDVVVTEGDSGSTTANFAVTLLGSTGSNVTVKFGTSNGIATEPSDYDAIEGQLVFLPGETMKTVSVNVTGDRLDEPDETFFVNLTGASNSALLDNQGKAIISDNDEPPTLTINDMSINEGSGPTTLSLTVHLTAPALTGGVTFDIATADGTATDGIPLSEDKDYVPRALTSVGIPSGSQDFTFEVTVNGDLTNEPNETLIVNVTNVSGAVVGDGQAVATIQNDDSPVLKIADAAQAEGNSGTTILNFIVTSSLPAPSGGITFVISTADGTAQDDSPTTEDNDYVAVGPMSFSIPEGQMSVVVPITINADTLVETDETFMVNVSNILGASANDPQALGTIQNDDVPNLVISQIYPGGGNAGATYRNDFIEIFNRGTTTVDFALTPYSVQYIGASGSFGSVSAANKTNIVTGTIGPGQYFLVQEASGGLNGIALPAVDALGGIAMAATGGKVALVLGVTVLPANTCPGDDAASPTNPSGNNIVDFAGYGSGANTPNCFEGSGSAAFSTSTAGGLDPDARSVVRFASCVDNNNNSTDFTNPTTAPVARSKSTAPAPCP